MNTFYSLCVMILILAPTFNWSAKAQNTQNRRGRPARQRPVRPVPATDSASRKLSPEELAKYALPSVPLVVCSDGNSISQGSGFFIAPGLLVTNYHVISGMMRGSVRIEVLKQKFNMSITRVVEYDERLDLAFLEVPDAVSFKIPSLKLLASDDIQVGETIYALGNPEGLTGTFSPGIVSAQERLLRDNSYMQISAPVSHGSSGGPVINSRGEVVGVVIGSIEEGQNLNFAIPAKYVKGMMDQVLAALRQPVTVISTTGNWTWARTPPEIRAKELVARGDEQSLNGQTAEALGSYLEALNLSPGLVEANRGLSSIYEQQASPLIKGGKYVEALRLLKQSVEIYPDNFLAYFQMGRAYSLMNQDDTALESYSRAIKLKPDFALAHYAKGISLVSVGQVGPALEEVSTLKPLDAKLSKDLFDFINETVLTSNLSILRQELQAQGNFSTPLQFSSGSGTEMTVLVVRSLSGCQISWRQSTATIATNYSSAAVVAHYTDYELNMKDLDPERIRLDQSNNGKYYIYLPTAGARTSIKRTSFLSLPNGRGKQDESRETNNTFSAIITIKNQRNADDLIKAFKMSSTICSMMSTNRN